MEEQELNLKSYVIKYSIIIALVGIATTTLVYIVDETIMIKWWFGLISLAITLGLLIYFGNVMRKENGGYLSFKKGFIFVFLIVIFSSIISTAYSLILYNVIDPDLGARLTEALVDQTTQMLQNFNLPEDQIDESIDKMLEKDNFSAISILQSAGIGSVVGGLILGLIVGAIIKKKRVDLDIM